MQFLVVLLFVVDWMDHIQINRFVTTSLNILIFPTVSNYDILKTQSLTLIFQKDKKTEKEEEEKKRQEWLQKLFT